MEVLGWLGEGNGGLTLLFEVNVDDSEGLLQDLSDGKGYVISH